MSSIINIDERYIQQSLDEFAKFLRGAKCSEGKMTYTKVFESEHKHATLYYTPLAWFKMTAVLDQFDKEVAWHGVAERVAGEEDAYIISDIMVYPQTVTGATVEMDELEYGKWLMENDDDPRWHMLHSQFHSHVRMGTSPSAVDINHQNQILDQVKDDGFYIFGIYNKRMEYTLKIFDRRINTLFENKDITVKIYGIEGINDFVSTSKAVVVEKKPTYVGGQNYYNGGNYGNYSGNIASFSQRSGASEKHTAPTSGSMIAGRGTEKPKGTINGSNQVSLYNYYDD